MRKLTASSVRGVGTNAYKNPGTTYLISLSKSQIDPFAAMPAPKRQKTGHPNSAINKKEAPLEKPAVESEDEDDSEATESSSDEEGETSLDISFSFENAVDSDFHGLKTLCRQLLSSPDFESKAPPPFYSDLAEHIIERNGIGCVVKIEGEEDPDPFAIVTAVGLHNSFWTSDDDAINKEKMTGPDKLHRTLAHLRSYLCGKDKTGKLAQLLSAGDAVPPSSNKRQTVALLLSSRLVNMPPQIAPPMHKSLLTDCAHAVSLKENEYDFGYAVYIGRTFVEEDPDQEEGDEVDVSKPSSSDPSKPDSIQFFHPEDEMLAKHAMVNITIRKAKKIAGAGADASEGGGIGRVMLVLDRKGWEAAVDAMVKENV
ncbi:Mss4p nuclear export [Gonapodya sp. JEL0774]|nr:Mss4p nuclear export [Gonapodya sp. JEL0774]